MAPCPPSPSPSLGMQPAAYLCPGFSGTRRAGPFPSRASRLPAGRCSAVGDSCGPSLPPCDYLLASFGAFYKWLGRGLWERADLIRARWEHGAAIQRDPGGGGGGGAGRTAGDSREGVRLSVQMSRGVKRRPQAPFSSLLHVLIIEFPQDGTFISPPLGFKGPSRLPDLLHRSHTALMGRSTPPSA